MHTYWNIGTLAITWRTFVVYLCFPMFHKYTYDLSVGHVMFIFSTHSTRWLPWAINLTYSSLQHLSCRYVLDIIIIQKCSCKLIHISDKLIRYVESRIYSLSMNLYVVCEHWPATCEFITQTIKLWNRWIRMSCYYNRV